MYSKIATLAVFTFAVAACGDGSGAADAPTDTVEAPTPTLATPSDTAADNDTAVDDPPVSTIDREQDESPPPPPVKTAPTPTLTVEPDEVGAQRGQMQITVFATPETVDDVVPTVVLDGIDVFATNCVRDPFTRVLSEITYVCGDLELAVYDVTAAPVDGIEPTLGCSPVGSFEGWDPLVANVGVDGFVNCSLSVFPPGLRIELFGIDDTEVTTVEIRDVDGAVVDANCRRIDPPDDPFPGDAQLQCDPLPLGSYEIPRQDVDGSGIEQPFVCLPGFGAGNGPDLDGTFRLDDRTDDELGVALDVWTCVNDEPEGPLKAQLLLAVDADASIADDLQVQVLRGGADIFGDACRSSAAPGYLDPGTEGFRFYSCDGDWWGELTPVIANPPAGVEVSVSCFEQNPVTGVIGPTAMLDPEIGEPWICRVAVESN